ncbi:MAG TPA: response regulator [Kofleriaceae bacterium]|nr:response regulator [Kofleriaceae bacterium]
MTARPILVRAEVPMRDLVAPLLVTSAETAVLRTASPTLIGDRLALRVSFPRVLAAVTVDAEVVGCRASGAPGEHAEWHLRLEPGPGATALAALIARASAPPPGVCRLLFVEDSAILRDVFGAGLRRQLGARAADLTIDVAGDVEAAWALLTRHAYELVVVDYFLPGALGDELIARLRRSPRATTPVVAVSRGGDEACDATLAAGADLFLDKPLALTELCPTIGLLFAKGSVMSPKRILIMDDSLLFLELTRDALVRAGYEVATANQLGDLDPGTERVDLVLMDVQMPEAFGDDLAMVLRHVRGLEVPIFLLSSLDPEELERRAADAGVDGFISKHAGIDAVVARVEQITGGPQGAR